MYLSFVKNEKYQIGQYVKYQPSGDGFILSLITCSRILSIIYLCTLYLMQKSMKVNKILFKLKNFIQTQRVVRSVMNIRKQIAVVIKSQ